MANISKITLPDGGQYNLKDSSAVHGVKGNAEATYRTGEVNIQPSDLGLGTAAMLDSSSTVISSSSTTLPTGAAVSNRINNHIIFSKTQPLNQKAGDIWVIIAEKASDPSYSQVANESGTTAIIT